MTAGSPQKENHRWSTEQMKRIERMAPDNTGSAVLRGGDTQGGLVTQEQSRPSRLPMRRRLHRARPMSPSWSRVRSLARWHRARRTPTLPRPQRSTVRSARSSRALVARPRHRSRPGRVSLSAGQLQALQQTFVGGLHAAFVACAVLAMIAVVTALVRGNDSAARTPYSEASQAKLRSML